MGGVLRADYGQSGAVQDFNESGIVNAQGDSLPQNAVSWGPPSERAGSSSCVLAFSLTTLPHGGCQQAAFTPSIQRAYPEECPDIFPSAVQGAAAGRYILVMDRAVQHVTHLRGQVLNELTAYRWSQAAPPMGRV